MGSDFIVPLDMKLDTEAKNIAVGLRINGCTVGIA